MKSFLIAAAVVCSMGAASQAKAGCWFPGQRALRATARVAKAVKNRERRPVRRVVGHLLSRRPGIIFRKGCR